jgi:hypothetical protein
LEPGHYHETFSRTIASRIVLVISIALAASTVSAQTTPGSPTPDTTKKSPLLIIDNDTFLVKGRVEAALGGYLYRSSFFNLPSAVFPDYEANHRWMEGWFEPGIDVVFRPHKKIEIYAGLSVGFSGTWGTDQYATRDEGRVALENAFTGIRTTNPETSWNVDLSVGQQNYEVGTGMLLSLGAENGFESGAVNLLPRTAWSNATLARFSYRGFHLDAFYVDPNSLSDTLDRIVGGVADYRWGEESRAGLSYVKVLRSKLDYPAAKHPPIIEQGRDEMYALDGFALVEGASLGLKNVWLRGEVVVERNPRIDMKAYALYGAAGYRFQKPRFKPEVSIEYAVFSGDDRDTATYERFDPLFYGESTVNWYFGANNCYAFLNANVSQLRSTLSLAASENDSITFEHVHSRANKLFSPIQIGALEREEVIDGQPTLVNGVTSPHLADEVYADWTRKLRTGLEFSLWGSASIPGRGLKTLPGANAKTWLGLGVSLELTF